jgi:ketosteroid isomerase-like protein
MRYLTFLCFLTLPLTASSADGEPPTIEARLRDYYSAIAKKDVAIAVAYFHPESQKIERAKTEISEFTLQFDLSYKISEVREVGRVDGDIVISFAEQTTFSVVDGKKLNTFTAKVLMVWRKDKSGTYKIWDSLPLSPAKAENADKQKG